MAWFNARSSTESCADLSGHACAQLLRWEIRATEQQKRSPGSRTNYAKPLTTMSPLQYQKQLRLQAARGRMLMDGLDAASAAFEVGYESPSQFNREYSRFFGQPPMRDIRTLRSPGAPALESVGRG